MTTIKIISGVYGHRPEKSPYVIPVTVNDPPISVEDDEAIRLVELGVAAYVEAETPPTAVATAPGCDSDSCPIDPAPKLETARASITPPERSTAISTPKR